MLLDEIADDLTNYLCRMDDYFVAHRLMKTRSFGNRTGHAYVTLSKSGSYRLFFTLVSKAQSSIHSSALLKALHILVWGDAQAA
ncbi:hypothetical protein [uncultured Mitsuokella sp.]|uniref:hypothetical protein n=1 Tax=uncultured Mitsuokella sp. TaxID=453120 RepID=UPI00259249FE|nr:hypothetical protein [uncultured Mitsuokella sp.]